MEHLTRFSQSVQHLIRDVSPKLKSAYGWCQVQWTKGNTIRVSFVNRVKTEVPKKWAMGRSFVVLHQRKIKVMSGALTLLVVARKLYTYWQSLPEYPQFAMVSSLHFARVMIGMPEKEKERERHIRLVFCIDTSGSMDGKNENAVKKGMEDVLRDAAKRVNMELQIEVAVIGFNTAAHDIVGAQELSNSTVEPILEKVKGYRSNGSTSIVSGIERACDVLKKMDPRPETSSALILLTDGVDNAVTKDKGNELAQRVANLGAKFFAIGIEGYRKDIVFRLVKEENLIDTTKGTPIAEAISILYGRAIAKFHGLRLYCPELPKAGQWSLKPLFFGEHKWVQNGEQGMTFPDLSEGEAREYLLQIDLNTLDRTVDLAQLYFKLAFRDPRGIEGEAKLWWGGNVVAEPTIFTPKKKGYISHNL